MTGESAEEYGPNPQGPQATEPTGPAVSGQTPTWDTTRDGAPRRLVEEPYAGLVDDSPGVGGAGIAAGMSGNLLPTKTKMTLNRVKRQVKAIRQTSRAVRRVLFRGVLAGPPVTAIHLGPALPPASCGLPADSGGQPSNVRAGTPEGSLLTLLRVGFT